MTLFGPLNAHNSAPRRATEMIFFKNLSERLGAEVVRCVPMDFELSETCFSMICRKIGLQKAIFDETLGDFSSSARRRSCDVSRWISGCMEGVSGCMKGVWGV